MPARINIIGKRFGRLIVIAKAKPHIQPCGGTKGMSLCRCDCGNEVTVFNCNLVSGTSRSCGCLKREVSRQLRRTHGYAGHRNIARRRIYILWAGMKGRCLNANNSVFSRYGGRGIDVCDRWLSFENFLEDMGEGKEGWELERVDNNAGYCPANVVWATPVRQQRNKRNNRVLAVRGKTACLAELCEHFGVKRTIVKDRLASGWNVERAFFEPKRITIKRQHITPTPS